MKPIIIIALFLVLAAAAFAHPAWVKAGVTAIYDGYSGVKNAQGGYDTPAQVKITNVIDRADASGVQTTSTFQEVTTGITLTSQTATFKADDAIGAFWADPALINGLKQGDKFGVFTVVGKGPVTIRNKEWNAVMLNYQDGDVRQTYTFELSTGLLISMTEIHGKQEVYGYFNSINTDLSQYQYTGTGNNGQPGTGDAGTNTGTGGYTGTGQPSNQSGIVPSWWPSGQNGSGQSGIVPPVSNPIGPGCSSAFILALVPLSVLFYSIRSGMHE